MLCFSPHLPQNIIVTVMLNKRLCNVLKASSLNYSRSSNSVINNAKTPLISCKIKKLNFYGQSYPRGEAPLASANWIHKASRGDYFIVHRGVKDPVHNVYQAKSFENTGLSQHLVQAAERQDIIVPTDIQHMAIHKVVRGHNTLITAETGCGKTLAYLLPLLDQLLTIKGRGAQRPNNTPLAVILTPSRDLVQQIYNVAVPYCKLLNLDVRDLVGGRTKKKMMNPFVRNIDLLIATPGIFSKFVTNHLIDPSRVMHVVLDEADTLLDASFELKVSGVLKKIRFRNDLHSETGAQLTLVSATVPSGLSRQVSAFVDSQSIIKTVSKEAHKTLPNLPQRFLRLGSSQRPIELLKIVRRDVNNGNPIMIFTNRNNTCDWVSKFLSENDIDCISVNGDHSIASRIGAYARFDSGEVNVIACTDMLSRGMDTIRTKHVLNYEFPLTTFDYIHRIGRTGRIGSGIGCHVTNFVSNLAEIILVQKIEKSVRQMVDLPSVDGNTQKILGDRLVRSEENAMRQLIRR